MKRCSWLAGGEFDFANSLATSTVFASGTAAVDKFDGTAVTDYSLFIFGNGGADTLIGGAKDDTITVPDANFASIDGRGGNDTVVVAATTAGQLFDVSANASKMHNVEVLNLDNTATTSVSVMITGADVSAISGNNTIYIVGSLNDSVTIDGGFTQQVEPASPTMLLPRPSVTRLRIGIILTAPTLYRRRHADRAGSRRCAAAGSGRRSCDSSEFRDQLYRPEILPGS